MASGYRRQFLTIAFCLLALGSSAARADSIGYQDVVELTAKSAALRVEHYHDWSDATRPARFKMMTTGEDPFSAANTFSTLRVLDNKSGAELFRRPVPALTYLWIDPASKYIVGVSQVKRDNPYHLVVFNKKGERLLERSLLGTKWPETFESVTNWIYWYKQPSPRIELVEGETTAVLSVEDRAGVMRSVEFALTRPKEVLSAAPVNP
ncbi:hypothetical protein INH39_01040 [Massilia violaceinigra]|uniref:Uncharacterized protein n=1 Tax=Massilia violaceinigra TaxID=2045208 RepID=A0ABY4A899_9BURK|nr:hypothetical protein [Massilia violaceinigra]UOD30375.1 hypothetical protein INH39_01040 [Massilia violaceinigra]